MLHRSIPIQPNPSQHAIESPLQTTAQTPTTTFESSSSSRRDRELAQTGHRSPSWAAQSVHAHDKRSKMTGNSSGTSSSNPTAGSGRPSGRALPPPRFQRKQRPPRVQQALAANGNGSNNTRNANGGGTSSRRGGGRHAANANAQTSAASGEAGTLALGPANNWGVGTSNLVSLSMAAVNAASARGSVLHQAAAAAAASSSRSIIHDGHGMPLADSTLKVMPEAHLDPVQLHNRITFGMGHPTSPSIPLDVYQSDAAIHHTAVQSGLVVPSELQLTSLNVRARSQSHHGVQPISRLQQPSFDPNLHTGLASLVDPAALGVPANLRIRSHSLMNPMQSMTPIQPSVVPSIPGMYPVDNGLRITTSASSLGAQSTQSMEKKPLKSALKVRKSAPELEGHPPNALSIPPVPYAQPLDAVTSSALADLDYYGFSSTRTSPPDPSLNLPDNLQTEYAQQLKLLQQEYAIKAAKAERTRQRSLERARTPGSGSRTAPTVERNAPIASPKGVSFHDQVEVMDPVQQSRMQLGDARPSYNSWSDQWSPTLPMPAYAQHEDDGSSSLDIDSELEIGSNVGDRGHEDHFREIQEHSSPSPAQPEWSSPSVSSSAAALPSPSGAISHVTDSSTDSITPLYIQPSIQVEVIAPTPEVHPVELVAIDEHVPRPLADGAHPDIHELSAPATQEPANTQQASPRTSAESSGSSDSNKTILRLEPTSSEIAAQPSVLNAQESPGGVTDHVQHASKPELVQEQESAKVARAAPHSASPASPQRIEGRTTRAISNALPPPLTNLSFPNRQPKLQTSVFAPVSMLPDVASPTDSQSNSAQSFSDEPPQRWDLEERTRLSSIPSVSSLSSGIMGHERFVESPRVTAMGKGRLDPMRQRSMSALNPPAVGPRGSHAGSQAHDDASFGYLRGRAGPRSVLSANEMSSAASVESGSSHGAGSGASHLGRSYERSNAGSLLSHSSSGYGLQDSRGRAGSTASRRSNLSDAAPITAAPTVGMPQTIPEIHPFIQPAMPSMPSFDSISVASGRSGGSSGSALPAASLGLGRDSIWTLGKEEETGWPAPPSSNGHSSAPSAQQLYHYPLESAAPEPLSAKHPHSRTNQPPFDYEYGLAGELPELQHPYNPVDRASTRQAALPNMRTSQHSTMGYNDYDDQNLHLANQKQVPLGYPDPSLGYGHSLSSPAFARYDDEPTTEQISVMLSPYELEQLRALRLAQVRAQGAPFVPPPPSSGYGQKHLPSQVSTRSLPAMGSGIPPQYQAQQLPTYVPDLPSGRPSSASRPSTGLTGKSSHSGDSGETIGRRSVVALPASGGVFPRYQEFHNPYPENSTRPGSSGGRFKSLFKSRDSRVFK